MAVLWFVPLLLATHQLGTHSHGTVLWLSEAYARLLLLKRGSSFCFLTFVVGSCTSVIFTCWFRWDYFGFYGWFSSKLAKWVALQYKKVRLCYCVIKLHQFKQLCCCKFHMRQTWLCTSSDVHMAIYLPRLGFKELCFQTQFIAWQCECYG